MKNLRLTKVFMKRLLNMQGKIGGLKIEQVIQLKN